MVVVEKERRYLTMFATPNGYQKKTRGQNNWTWSIVDRIRIRDNDVRRRGGSLALAPGLHQA